MKISVIGAAGTLGSCTTYSLIIRKLADEVVMIDAAEGPLKGHWMDLETVGRTLDINVIKGTYEDMRGSDIVVMVASAPSGAIKSRSELLPGSIPTVKANVEKINQFCPDAIVIMETNPVDPFNYFAYLMSKDKDRRKYIGYSLNDTIRLRMWAAQALKVKTSRVDGIVIGEHGGSQVMLFSSLKLDGKPVKLDEATKAHIREQPPIMLNDFETLIPKRTAGWTSGMGTAIVVEAIKNNSQAVIPCNTVLQGEYGLRGLSMTMPAIVGKRGIQGVKVYDLAPDEQEGLKKTVETLNPFMRYVEEYLKNNQ
jgi:malate/lactate dehydrogenase